MARVIKLGIKRRATQPLLPDPEPSPVLYTLISVDDHVMEPPHTFAGRLPARFAAQVPRVVETEEGHQVWVFEDTPYFQVGFICVAGRAREDQRVEPARFDEMRPGCFDPAHRIKDMDINGVWASLNYPSGVTGFGGTLFSEATDPELGLACVRAWNDWVYEEWHRPYPERIIPLGITFLDHVVAESDYPHGDGTWPHTQRVMERMLSGLPVEWIRKITHENAAKLYRHPLPPTCLP